MKGNINFYRKLYAAAFIILGLIMVFSPLFFKKTVSFVSEDTAEMILILLLLFVGYYIFRLYQREVKRLNLDLQDNFKYIGKLNVHFAQIDSLLESFTQSPYTKADLKSTLDLFLEKALAVVSVDWIYLRIVDMKKIRVLAEAYKTRHAVQKPDLQISFKELAGLNSDQYLIFSSNHQNTDIKAFFILPRIELEKSQETLLQLKIDYLCLAFLVYSLTQPKVKV